MLIDFTLLAAAAAAAASAVLRARSAAEKSEVNQHRPGDSATFRGSAAKGVANREHLGTWRWREQEGPDGVQLCITDGQGGHLDLGEARHDVRLRLADRP